MNARFSRTLTKQLLSARIMRGLTQGQLASLADTTQSAVSEWETGKNGISVDTAEKVAAALGFDLTVTLVPWEVSRGLAPRFMFDEPERTNCA